MQALSRISDFPNRSSRRILTKCGMNDEPRLEDIHKSLLVPLIQCLPRATSMRRGPVCRRDWLLRSPFEGYERCIAMAHDGLPKSV